MSCNKVCVICNTEFISESNSAKYCSEKCRKIKIRKSSKEYYVKNSEKIKKKSIDWDKNNIKKRQETSKKYAEKNKEKITKYRKEYYEKNKDDILKKCKLNYQKNKEVISEKSKKYYQKNKEHIKNKTSQWTKDNKDKVLEAARKRQKRKIKTNAAYRLNSLISCQIRVNLKRKKGFKTFDLLGYTSHDLKIHLESKFKKGMTWDNHGRFGWHIDHIKPVASFKFVKENEELDLEQIKQCWSLDNLQPLWANDNESKSSWCEVDGKMCRFLNGEIVEVREDFN